MSGFPILDLILGVLFFFFLISIIVSSVVEIITTVTNARAEILAKWLQGMFDKPSLNPEGKYYYRIGDNYFEAPLVKNDSGDWTDPAAPETVVVTKDGIAASGTVTVNGNPIPLVRLSEAIMDHCITTALSKRGEPTSFISSKDFVSALLEKIGIDPADPSKIPATINEYIHAINTNNLLSQELKRTLVSYAQEAGATYAAVVNRVESDIDIFKRKVEDWYDRMGDRIQGNLKKNKTNKWTFFVALITVILLNADTIRVSQYLYENPEVRARVAAQAVVATKDKDMQEMVERARREPDSTKITTVDALVKNLDSSITQYNRAVSALKQNDLPLFWDRTEFQNRDEIGLLATILSKIFGLAATVLAVLMGAPFWFDILNRLANIRGNGAKPPTAAAEDKAKRS